MENWWLERGGRLQNYLSRYLFCLACDDPSHAGTLWAWSRGASPRWMFCAVTGAVLWMKIGGLRVMGCWDLGENKKCG